jgi:hypothetical protein
VGVLRVVGIAWGASSVSRLAGDDATGDDATGDDAKRAERESDRKKLASTT